MTKQNKELLTNLKLNELKLSNPSFPIAYLPQPKYSDKTANGLTKCVIDFLNLSGHQAERVSSMGRMLDNRKTVTDVLGGVRQIGSTKYIKGTSTNGTADISSIINGKSVKIEIKIGADRQSKAQKDYQIATEKAGGIYLITKTFDEFMAQYTGLSADVKLLIVATHKETLQQFTSYMTNNEWMAFKQNNNYTYENHN